MKNKYYIKNPEFKILYDQKIPYGFFPHIQNKKAIYAKLSPKIVQLLKEFNGEKNTEDIIAQNASKEIPKLIQNLIKFKILIPKEKQEDLKKYIAKINAKRDAFAILPTNQCNLRCQYCYASAGDYKTITISKKSVDIALNYFFSKLKKRVKSVSLILHGRGEPTQAQEILEYATTQFKKKAETKKLTHYIGMVTNGVFSKKSLDWMIAEKNLVKICMSFDGTKQIQNKQRPLANGKGSYDYIISNIKKLIEAGKTVQFRATVVKETQDAMVDLIRLAKELGVSEIAFEPLFKSDRATARHQKPPLKEDFIAAFIKAYKVSLRLGIKIRTSHVVFDKFAYGFHCGATRPVVVLTPEGYISSCIEKPNPPDFPKDIFIYGEVAQKKNKIIINPEHLKQLKEYRCDSNCYLSLICNGYCLSQVLKATGKTLKEKRQSFCKTIQEINAYFIAQVANKKIKIRELYHPKTYHVQCEGYNMDLITFNSNYQPKKKKQKDILDELNFNQKFIQDEIKKGCFCGEE